MHTSHNIQDRRALLIELIAEGQGTSQKALVDALATRGVEVTQATLSRDLKELGAVKGPGGYAVDGVSLDPLAKAMGTWLSRADVARNLVVLRTPPGGASPLAVALDGADRREILGTIAGDDTIMVVARTDAAAKALAAEFTKSARGGN